MKAPLLYVGIALPGARFEPLFAVEGGRWYALCRIHPGHS